MSHAATGNASGSVFEEPLLAEPRAGVGAVRVRVPGGGEPQHGFAAEGAAVEEAAVQAEEDRERQAELRVEEHLRDDGRGRQLAGAVRLVAVDESEANAAQPELGPLAGDHGPTRRRAGRRGKELDEAEFLQTFATSMKYLQLEHVDLLSLHGINNRQLLEWSLQKGGLF